MSLNVTPKFSAAQRLRLVALAVGIETCYLILAFVPAAVIAVLSAVIYGPQRGLLVGLMLLALVAWFIRQNPYDDRQDTKLPEGTGLHGMVESLSKDIDVPPIHDIVLNDELNASAFASNGFYSLFGVRRKLTVGVPLLRLLSADELKAVIAHELGHFSRKHDRIGQWIYRVQYKWGIFFLMRRTESDSFIESAQKLVARRLIPYFLQQSSAWSHQCEYEADASAQGVGLSKHLIAALTKVEVCGYLRQGLIRHEMVRWRLQCDVPPADTLEQMVRLTQREAQASFEAASAYAREYPRGLYDTHPRLHERANALQVDVSVPVWEGACAGEALLCVEWKSVLDGLQSRWTAKNKESWRFAHYRLKWLEAQTQLQECDTNAQTIAAATLSKSPESLAALRKAASDQPANAYLQYELGHCLLDARDEAGLAHLQESIKLNKKMAIAALQLIHDFHQERDSTALIGRSLDRLAAANRWAAHFCDESLWKRFCTEPLEALPDTGRALFAEAVESDPRIDGCWVGSLQSKVIEGYQFKIHLIVFRLDGSNIHEPNRSEDHVREQMTSLLQVVSRPDELIRVKSVFFAEPFNPNLLENLEKHPQVCITKPRQAFNQDLIMVDSA